MAPKRKSATSKATTGRQKLKRQAKANESDPIPIDKQHPIVTQPGSNGATGMPSALPA